MTAATVRLFDEIEFQAKPEGLYDPLRYMISIGGKRIRPSLCLLSYALFKDELGPEVMEPAASLEVFHTFTLIHDDIMDRSPLRRGQETVWKKWCEDTAILSGDVMLIDAYKRKMALIKNNIQNGFIAATCHVGHREHTILTNAGTTTDNIDIRQCLFVLT